MWPVPGVRLVGGCAKTATEKTKAKKRQKRGKRQKRRKKEKKMEKMKKKKDKKGVDRKREKKGGGGDIEGLAVFRSAPQMTIIHRT